MRPVTTVYAGVDVVIVAVCAAVAPLGWLLGKAIYHGTVQLIPGALRSYPVAAFMWSAVAVGSPVVSLYQPAGSLAGTVLLPWLLAQVPAALLAAGLYGILEGWLAVDGARDWWPMRPPPQRDDADFGLVAPDLALPGIFDSRGQDEPGERTPIRRERS